MANELRHLIWVLRYSGHPQGKETDGGRNITMLTSSAHARRAKVAFDKLMRAINAKNANEKGYYPQQRCYNNGMPVLCYCISNGTLHTDIKTKKVIAKLLECGANPNLEDKRGYSAMFYAVMYRCDNWMLDLLIKHGGSLDKVSKGKETLWDVNEDTLDMYEESRVRINKHLNKLKKEQKK